MGLPTLSYVARRKAVGAPRLSGGYPGGSPPGHALWVLSEKRGAVVSSPDGPQQGRAQGRTAARRPVRAGGKPGVVSRRSVTTLV